MTAEQPPPPEREVILRTTLQAVQKQKIHRQRVKSAFVVTCSAVFLLLLFIAWRAKPLPHQQTHKEHDNLANNNSLILPLTKPNHETVEVDILKDGSIQTIRISLQELSAMVYNPNLKFHRTEDAFTWKGPYTLIHMHMPKTSMAIVDTKDESL